MSFDAETELVGIAAAILIAGIAAFTDWRSGRIPNWLTLPPLVIAPVIYGILYGWNGAFISVGGIVICGLVPFFLHRQSAIGGGDVKMVAAIGAVTGMLVGLEIEFVSFLVAGLYALGRLAWDGKLLQTLANSFFLALNPLLPKKWRRSVSPTMLSTVRMGGSFLAAGIMTVLSRHPYLFFSE